MTVKCVNKGCGQDFDAESPCVHHPGGPVFHDATKGWSCCKKRVVDFDAFLNIPGCTTGKHSTKLPDPKPKQPEPQTMEPKKELKQPEPAKQSVPVKPAPVTTPTPPAPAKKEVPKTPETELFDAKDAVIDLGAKCKRPTCTAEYESQESRTAECVYHPGTPVFHDALKGWSCCKKRVVDFDAFLSIGGCETGVHRFTNAVVVECRRDWYQTPDKVLLSIFAKKVSKEKTTVRLYEQKLEVDIEFLDQSVHSYHVDLFQPIDVAGSKFEILSTKIEITFKKANGISWASIEAGSGVTSWTTFGISGSKGGSVGGKEAVIAGDAPLHLLK